MKIRIEAETLPVDVLGKDPYTKATVWGIIRLEPGEVREFDGRTADVYAHEIQPREEKPAL